MKAHLYARYSTERQSESSIADQLRVCRQYAVTQGWTVIGEHTDEGISGAALGNRPGVRAALDAAQAGDVLLVMDLSRLSRSQDVAPLLTRLTHRGIRIIGVQDGYDSTSRTARMQAGLSGIMSEEFRAMIADRTRSALSSLANAGESTGGRAYGYRGTEADVVSEAFSRFAAGESLKMIASDFNRRGIPSPGADWKRSTRAKHGHWLVSALHELIKNERYAGKLVYNRSQWVKDPDSGKRRRIERPESEWIVKAIPALVDPEVWAAAQLRFRPGTGRGGVPSYLLSGLLECSACGSKFVVMGGSQRRYVCSAHHQGGPHACANGMSVPKSTVEQYVLQPVVDDLLSPAAVSAAMQEMRQAARAVRTGPDPQVAHLERLVREGVLTPEVAAPALAEAKRRAQPSPVTTLPSERLWRDAVAALRDILKGDDVIAAREALRELLGPIRLTPAGDHYIAELTARQVMLGTGNGIWIGSGGAIQIRIPTRRAARHA